MASSGKATEGTTPRRGEMNITGLVALVASAAALTLAAVALGRTIGTGTASSTATTATTAASNGVIGAGPASNPVATINISETEYGFSLSAPTSPPGDVNFVVKNDGIVDHEFIVFKTDIAAADLPLSPEGKVAEDSPQLKDLADSGTVNIRAGQSVTLHANLVAGHYVFVCDLPSHYKLGMRSDFTITA